MGGLRRIALLLLLLIASSSVVHAGANGKKPLRSDGTPNNKKQRPTAREMRQGGAAVPSHEELDAALAALKGMTPDDMARAEVDHAASEQPGAGSKKQQPLPGTIGGLADLFSKRLWERMNYDVYDPSVPMLGSALALRAFELAVLDSATACPGLRELPSRPREEVSSAIDKLGAPRAVPQNKIALFNSRLGEWWEHYLRLLAQGSDTFRACFVRELHGPDHPLDQANGADARAPPNPDL
jgi:hypothetical protein